jgi:hypothetical protein
MERNNIKLLVIDSITANFRGQDESEVSTAAAPPQRANGIYEIGEILHELATRYQSVILLVNEVSAKFERVARVAHDTHSSSILSSEPNDGCSYVPALGVALSVIVNTRIRLHRSENEQRTMHIIFSPSSPTNAPCSFILDHWGIRGIP